ncbi:MAG: alpha/beta fold hydrolase [Actinomycetota bacterium]
MANGRRFLAYGLGAFAAAAASGRVISWRDRRRADPARDEAFGSLRGHPRYIRGPRASSLYTEWFPSKGGNGTLLMTHGYCLTEAVWHYQKRDLAGDRFGLATWDLPGHGHSPGLAPGHLTLEYCVDALARVVDEYADGGVVLTGHSLGGVITLAYLARHPETAQRLVKGAVIVSTPMMHFARSVAGRWPGASLEARVLGKGMQALVDSGLTERVLGRDTGGNELGLSYRVVRWGFGRSPSPSHVLFVRDAIASVRPDVRAETYRIMTGADLSPLLPEIKVPAVVVIGGRDRLVNPLESKAMSARLPKGRLVEFEGAGHAAFLEDHDRFNELLQSFATRRLLQYGGRRNGKRPA